MKKMKKSTRTAFLTYLVVILVFAVMYALDSAGMLTRSLSGQLVPICCYMSMAVSLNLTVGILGELSLGHAGFMSVGAFSGVIASMYMKDIIPSVPLRLALTMIVGAALAAVAGVIVGAPVLRLRGDYLAIVTLAFGEIIKDLVNCLIVGYDSKGLHVAMNLTGNMSINDLGLEPTGVAIIKGAQGATGTLTIANFTAGFILVMITLFVVFNLVNSRAGRAIMALRDNTHRRRERGHQHHQVQDDGLCDQRGPGRRGGCPVRGELLLLAGHQVQLQHLHPDPGVCGAGGAGQPAGAPWWPPQPSPSCPRPCASSPTIGCWCMPSC